MGFAWSMQRRGLRGTAAISEILVSIVLAGLTWWCWQRGVIVAVRRGVPMSHITGGWWAGATGAATLAGLLLLDAGRRVAAESSREMSRQRK